MKSSFVTLLALVASHAAADAASDALQTQLVEGVITECKGRFLSTLVLIYPEDEPGRALDELSTKVCLDYAHFLPRK